MPTSIQTFEAMLAIDLALGTGLEVGESLEERYSEVEGYAATVGPTGLPALAPPGVMGVEQLQGELTLAGFDFWAVAEGVVTALSWWDELFGGAAEEPMANGDTGVDLYGHEGVVMNGGGVPVGGPGVPEPPQRMIAKQWKTKAFSNTIGEYWVHFFRLVDGRMMCYNAAKREWKMWRPKKPLAVLYRGKITLSQAVKVQAYLDKLWKNVAKRTKAIKMA